MREIKTRFGGNIYRIFFTINEDANLLHGFQKKLKTPAKEITTAVKRLKQYHKDRKGR